MRNGPLGAAIAVAAIVCAWPDVAISQTSKETSIPGMYRFYSGKLGDELGLPNNKDAKVSIMVSGPLAARMYRHMGSAAQKSYSCLDDEETRIRSNLMCTRKKDTGKAECYFGFDLHSGKSIIGTVC